METDFFPKVMVTGEAFCNRQKERKLLASYIRKGRHTWIQAHRRHGKTSLVGQTIEDIAQQEKVVYERCHLRFAADSTSCVKKLVQGIEALITQLLHQEYADKGLGEKVSLFTDTLTNLFRRLSPKLSIERNRPTISTTDDYSLDALEDAIGGLDKLAKKYGYRAVLFIDEFQEVGKLPDHMQLESTIRQGVEEVSATTFIFAGSERTLMAQVMGEKRRPLYKHTQPFPLERIEASEYRKHLAPLATHKWGAVLEDRVLDDIFYLTQRHPYYINWLCDELWQLDSLPQGADVQTAWHKIVYLSEREEGYAVRGLSINEKKLVLGIARGDRTKMQSVAVTSRLGLAPSSVQRSINTLLKKDIIDQNELGYYIINPALATYALLEG